MIKTALALAAATLLCAAPAAAQTVRVPFGDLNLSTAAGAEAFDARVAEAGREVCTTGSARLVNTSCVKRIQREAVRELPLPPGLVVAGYPGSAPAGDGLERVAGADPGAVRRLSA